MLVQSDRPLRNLGRMDFVINYKNKFDYEGHAEVSAESFDSSPEIAMRSGRLVE